jgi:uridine kinase
MILASLFEHDDQISVMLPIDDDRLLAIGDKMGKINELAYMNGQNWEAFFDYYLQQKHPDIHAAIEDTDSEAGTYIALLENSNLKTAQQFVDIINNLLQNEAEIYAFLTAEGENIEWD